MASAISPITGSSAANSTSSSSSSSATNTPAPSEQVFLQLLVAQLKNQDPLNPTDSTQFVAELAQFSELEQVIAIRSDIEGYAAQAQAAQGTQNSTSGSSSNPTSGTAPIG